MRGKVILSFVFLLLLVQLTSAYTTEIHVKTKPFHEVQVSAYRPGSVSFQLIGVPMKADSDQYGDAYLTFEDTASVFNLMVYIKKDGEKIMPPERFEEEYSGGGEIYLEVAPSGFEFLENPADVVEEINETENDTLVVEPEVVEDVKIIEEEAVESGSGITGAAVGDFFSSKAFYYIIAGIALLFVVFITAKVTQHRLVRTSSGSGIGKEPKKINVKKLSEVKKKKEEKIENYKDIIDDAEKKIKEAQEEIKNLKERGSGESEEKRKKQEKMDEIKEKMKKYEKELIEMRQEKD